MTYKTFGLIFSLTILACFFFCPKSYGQNCTPPGVGLNGSACSNSAAFMMSAVTYLNQITPELSQIAYYQEFEMLYREVNSPSWNSLKVYKAFGEFRIFGLEPCTKYELKSRTICSATESSSLSNSLFFETACDKPTNLEITQVTTDEASVNYRSFVTGFCGASDSYTAEIQYRETNGVWQSIYCSKGQACKLYLLTPGTKYSVRVRFKYDLNKYSDFTNEVSFTTKGTSSSGGGSAGGNNGGGNSSGGNGSSSNNSMIIPNLFITSGANFVTGVYHQINVNFDDVYSNVEYEVGTNPSFVNPLISSSFDTDQSYFSVLFPTVDVYYIRVRGVLPSGLKSNWSAYTKVNAIRSVSGAGAPNTSNSGCPTLSYSINSNIGTDCIELSWFDASNPKLVETIHIEYREVGGLIWSSIDKSNSLFNSATLQNLEACTTYEIKTQSYCAQQTTSAWTNMNSIRTDCPKPNNLKATQPTNISALISFQKTVGLSCSGIPNFPFEIQYKTTSGTWQTQSFNGGTSGMLTNLQPSTAYRVRIRYKYSTNNYSDFSNEIIMSTLKSLDVGSNSSSSKPILTSPIKSGTVKSTSTTLKWKFTGATTYEIIVDKSVLFNNATSYFSSAQSLVISNLIVGNTYYWKVRAQLPDGSFSDWSDIYYFRRK